MTTTTRAAFAAFLFAAFVAGTLAPRLASARVDYHTHRTPGNQFSRPTAKTRPHRPRQRASPSQHCLAPCHGS